MRIPNERHLAEDLRVHGLLADFTLEDVWELPEISGDLADFDEVVAMSLEADPTQGGGNPASRFVWWVREMLGRWFGLGEIDETGNAGLPIPGGTETSIGSRLPEDLRGTVEDLRYESLPFVPVYRTDTEYAAEISNATVHGVLHLSWVPRADGRFQGRMAVYVKPRGRLGAAYMAFIKPFRYLIVYPALERQLAREWRDRGARPADLG